MAKHLLLPENKVVEVTHVDMKVWFNYNLCPVLVLHKHLIIAGVLSLKLIWYTTSSCCIELQPWPPPLLFYLMGTDVMLQSTPWPSFSESAAAMHLQNSSVLVLVISLTVVQTLSVWQEVSARTPDSINLVLTLCSHIGESLYQPEMVKSYRHTQMLQFSFSQYASLLLHSSQWCFCHLWKPPWPRQGHVLTNCSESVVQVLHVFSVTKKHLVVSVLRWQEKCDGNIKWNDYFLSDGDLIIIWSTTEERRATNCMRHGSCYSCVVWGGPIILVSVSASGYLLGVKHCCSMFG
jgi:hypothetical protein